MSQTARPGKRPAQGVPQSRAECERLIADIHGHRATLKEASDVFDVHLTELRERHQRQAAPIAEEIARLTGLVQAWCEANRGILTDGGRTKTVALATGRVSWRKGLARVELEADAADVLASLKAMRLKKFIRLVEEIDKAEMLRTPVQAATVPGVRIVAGVETFAILPQSKEAGR